MKTPEEIKKGLECCVSGDCPKEGCPYYKCQEDMWCGEQKSRDALALIQQLEDQNAELLEKVKQLQAEQAETMEAIKKGCRTCKHSYLNNPDIEICQYVTKCDASDSHWEWRGPQKKNQ